MTALEGPAKRREIARRASIVAGGILLGAALIGAFVFKFYGITLPALKVAGGILLFFIAFDMINARASRSKNTPEEQSEGAHREDIAVFPLAMPLLVGPGSIVSVFMLTDQATTWLRHIALYGAIVITMFTVYVTLKEAHRVMRFMGQIGINVFSRIMGLLLAALAVQFVIDGLHAAFPTFSLG